MINPTLLRLAIVFAALLLGRSALANDTGHYFVSPGTEFIQLQASETGHDYELLVSLPSNYADEPDRLYPTLYLTDAQWDMALVTSIVGKLNYDNLLPDIIIVGLTYPGADADYGALRDRDLSPVRVEQVNAETGGGPQFLSFIESEVIPLVEARYRSDPNERALGGVSFGGLFALYALYEKTELFGRFISISPATVWAQGYIFRRDNEFAETGQPLRARVFLAYGGNEYPPFRDPIARFQRKLDERNYDGLELKNWEVSGARHGGVAVEGWIRGINWVFADLAPGKPDPIELMFDGESAELRIVE